MDSQRIAAIVAAALCAIAILSLPYGYYMLLRCVVTGTAIYLLLTAKTRLIDVQVLALIVLLLLFNPIWKVHLGRELWKIMDGVTSAFFLWVGFSLGSKKS